MHQIGAKFQPNFRLGRSRSLLAIGGGNSFVFLPGCVPQFGNIESFGNGWLFINFSITRACAWKLRSWHKHNSLSRTTVGSPGPHPRALRVQTPPDLSQGAPSAKLSPLDNRRAYCVPTIPFCLQTLQFLYSKGVQAKLSA